MRVYSGTIGVLVMAILLAPPLAEELAKADTAPAVTAQVAQTKPATSVQDLYMICAFYPKPDTCETVYQQAMKDNSISAEAVRAEYTGYARYLTGAASLTETDRQFLKDNGIRVPEDLSPADQAGLHNVINDVSVNGNAKPTAVNNFLSRAVQAELYCGLNSCDGSATESAAAGMVSVR